LSGKKMAVENWSEKHIVPAEAGQNVFKRKRSVTAAGAKNKPCTQEGTGRRIFKL